MNDSGTAGFGSAQDEALENRNAAIGEVPGIDSEPPLQPAATRPADSRLTDLSAVDVHNLQFVGKVWVCASYLQDETIERYHRLGLVDSDGLRIRLTLAGRRACVPASQSRVSIRTLRRASS